MRASVRPLLFFLLLCALAATAHSQSDSNYDSVVGGSCYLAWAKGSPKATPGGVDAEVVLRPAAGYSCTSLVIRVVDDATGATLDTMNMSGPASPATTSFHGLGRNRLVQVRADATFQNGN